ncbi:hypothetical protein L479_02337 [Exiguobacterium sp. S17]|nr:hypothetical protein L479_02337 [Exiguobacterium sp. S17]
MTWMFERLSSGLETRNIIFSVEKILKECVLLHVRSDSELFAVYLNFRTGRFSMPVELEQMKKAPLN